MVSGQIQKCSMAVTGRRGFLTKPLSENDNRDINSGDNGDNDSCIRYYCGYLLFSYPYRITPFVTEMEKTMGII